MSEHKKAPKKAPRPADGGSYKHQKDGSYKRLDEPQQPNPGKTALKRQAKATKAAAAEPAEAEKPADAGKSADNVRELRGKSKE